MYGYGMYTGEGLMGTATILLRDLERLQKAGESQKSTEKLLLQVLQLEGGGGVFHEQGVLQVGPSSFKCEDGKLMYLPEGNSYNLGYKEISVEKALLIARELKAESEKKAAEDAQKAAQKAAKKGPTRKRTTKKEKL